MNLLEQMFKDVDTGSEELAKEELSNGSGVTYVKEGGIYKGTIERCFVTTTKKGGACLDIHIGGESVFNTKLYPVTVRDGKKVTTYVHKGKSSSLNDYKMLKQLVFVATGKGQELEDITIEKQDIEYKEYGKAVDVTGGMLVDLIGKEIKFAVRLEEEYNYEDGETDKTSIKTDNDGNARYKKSIYRLYNAEGQTAIEMVKKEEPTQLTKDKDFLAGEKGIKRVKLDLPEIEEIVESSDVVVDDIDF